MSAFFWKPLKIAVRDCEQRIEIFIAGACGEANGVSVREYVVDSLFHSWIGISPTQGPCSLRFGLNVTARDVKIRRAHGLPNVSDVMRPAGLYPLQSTRHSSKLCPGPIAGKRIDLDQYGEAGGRAWLRMVLKMLHGLSRMNQVDLRQAEYSSDCHKSVSRCGPAGIGSTRWTRGFREYCGGFFPRRSRIGGFWRSVMKFCQTASAIVFRLGRGKFAVVIGLPCVRVTQRGDRWLDFGSSARSSNFCVSIATKLAPLMLRA